MKAFGYQRAKTPAEALSLAAHEGTAILAGGTDLVREMKRGLTSPQRLVAIGGVDEWATLACDGRRGLEAGGLVKLADLDANPRLGSLFPALRQAVSGVATPQIRNMATLAGTLMQRPSCWYYRGGFDCLLAGGSSCSAQHGDNRHGGVLGDGPCLAGHPSDVAAALIALSATVDIASVKADAVRRMPVEGLYQLPSREQPREHTLAHGEVITAVRIPAPTKNQRSVFIRVLDRATWAFPLVAVAARGIRERGRLKALRVVASGIAPIPWLIADPQNPTEGLLPHATSAYKLEILSALVRRAVAALDAGPVSRA